MELKLVYSSVTLIWLKQLTSSLRAFGWCIQVKDNGEIWLDKGRVDVERVGARIEKLLAEQPTDVVIIQADKNAKHGVVVKVMDAIKEAGIDRISIAAAKG